MEKAIEQVEELLSKLEGLSQDISDRIHVTEAILTTLANFAGSGLSELIGLTEQLRDEIYEAHARLEGGEN